jgi:hypothetical protein
MRREEEQGMFVKKGSVAATFKTDITPLWIFRKGFLRTAN